MVTFSDTKFQKTPSFSQCAGRKINALAVRADFLGMDTVHDHLDIHSTETFERTYKPQLAVRHLDEKERLAEVLFTIEQKFSKSTILSMESLLYQKITQVQHIHTKRRK